MPEDVPVSLVDEEDAPPSSWSPRWSLSIRSCRRCSHSRPECSCATTTPMATVAPVAARTAPRLNQRNRDVVLSRWRRALAHMTDGHWMGNLFRGDAPIPPSSTRHTRSAGCGAAETIVPTTSAENRRPATIARPGTRQTRGNDVPGQHGTRPCRRGGPRSHADARTHLRVEPRDREALVRMGRVSRAGAGRGQASRAQGSRHRHPRRPDCRGVGPLYPSYRVDRGAVPDINVVVATGVYTYNEVPMYFHFRGPGTILGGPEPMVDLFVREIQEGIGDTGVRAAILKCASDRPGITPGVDRVLRAVARAHRVTGVPITTHTPTPPEPWGLEQQRVFKEEGVDLARVVIGHSGGTVNTDYHLQLIDNGSYLGFDHFGLPGITLEERVDAVARLCERGYAERLVLSHDAMCFVDWFPRSVMDASSNWRWTYISDIVLPALRTRGISEQDITRMLVDNPRTVLEGGPAY